MRGVRLRQQRQQLLATPRRDLRRCAALFHRRQAGQHCQGGNQQPLVCCPAARLVEQGKHGCQGLGTQHISRVHLRDLGQLPACVQLVEGIAAGQLGHEPVQLRGVGPCRRASACAASTSRAPRAALPRWHDEQDGSPRAWVLCALISVQGSGPRCDVDVAQLAVDEVWASSSKNKPT